jgi:tetratricopeptide (TPR) repeat protein
MSPRALARQLVALLALLLFLGACVDQAGEHRVRANAFLRGGDAAAALKECDEGLAQKKGDVALLILRGKALFELDRLDDARGAYQAALDASAPGQSTSDAQLGLAMIASRRRDWAAARKHFEILVGQNPKDGSSHLNAAKACLELKDLDCAVSHAEEAGRLRGNEEPVLFALGSIYLAAGKPHEAELTFQHICEAAPGVASCPYGLALVAARAGDRKRALEQLDEAVRRKLPSPDQIAADPGFASLKDDPEFQRIAGRAKTPVTTGSPAGAP